MVAQSLIEILVATVRQGSSFLWFGLSRLPDRGVLGIGDTQRGPPRGLDLSDQLLDRRHSINHPAEHCTTWRDIATGAQQIVAGLSLADQDVGIGTRSGQIQQIDIWEANDLIDLLYLATAG